VQESTKSNALIRQKCDSKNEFFGSVGVYFPNSAYGHKRYMYRASEGIGKAMLEKVIRSVIQYSNSQMMDTIYTWQGVSNALLRDRLNAKGEELLAAETEKNRVTAETGELGELLEYADENNDKLKRQVEELTRANESLTYENQGLRSKLSSVDNVPILYLGEEYEFFHNEIKAIILDALKQALPQYESRNRRRDVLEDIIHSNDTLKSDNRAEDLKKALKGYKNVTGSIKRTMEEMGLVFDENAGKHYKVTYYGDERYMVTLAKTPSDQRTGINVATEIINIMF
jgi:hypothetical protein